MFSNRSLKTLLLATAVAVTVAAVGCTKNDPIKVEEVYPDPTSPANVLTILTKSYIRKNIEKYASILAEDFRFYFDPATRVLKGLPETWNRFDDSTGTALSIFQSDKIGDVKITLTYDAVPESVHVIGRENWLKIVALVDLDVDQKPDAENPEGITLRVTQQQQEFYFRRGFTPEDTLSTSATARNYYLTEWRDMGASSAS